MIEEAGSAPSATPAGAASSAGEPRGLRLAALGVVGLLWAPLPGPAAARLFVDHATVQGGQTVQVGGTGFRQPAPAGCEAALDGAVTGSCLLAGGLRAVLRVPTGATSGEHRVQVCVPTCADAWAGAGAATLRVQLVEAGPAGRTDGPTSTPPTSSVPEPGLPLQAAPEPSPSPSDPSPSEPSPSDPSPSDPSRPDPSRSEPSPSDPSRSDPAVAGPRPGDPSPATSAPVASPSSTPTPSAVQAHRPQPSPSRARPTAHALASPVPTAPGLSNSSGARSEGGAWAVHLDPDVVVPGAAVVVTAAPAPVAGLTDTCHLLWDGVSTGACRISGQGVLRGTFVVPAGARPGAHAITGCRRTCRGGAQPRADVRLRVTGPPVPPPATASSRPLVPVPDLQGLDPAAARERLRLSHLVLDDNGGAGSVDRQDPPAGAMAAEGATVTVHLSGAAGAAAATSEPAQSERRVLGVLTAAAVVVGLVAARARRSRRRVRGQPAFRLSPVRGPDPLMEVEVDSRSPAGTELVLRALADIRPAITTEVDP